MCGIAGYLEPPGRRSSEQARERLQRMRDSLAHRGPDDSGSWLDPEGGVALGHCRLSILDLSPTGHQPMSSPDGRYVMVYNGEVYNHPELRGELEGLGHSFRGTSDTEVMLAAFVQWGPEASLARFNGMFALALWDSQERQLLLARDRFGKKPLYYGRAGPAWVFASELKALRTLPDFEARVSPDRVSLYLRFGYVPAPFSIYEGISKLPAGSFLWLREPFQPQPLAPWSAAAGSLEEVLQQAVACRMLADVPVGAFLSGGIDSSLIVALMQQQSRGQVRTFSLGFQDPGYDESAYAREVARALGTAHTERVVTPEEAMEVIPELASIYDEPFADSSQIPTFLVSKLAREQVTVVLSGDGGDELFGGYNRYVWGPRLWRAIAWLPLGVRQVLASGLGRLSWGPLARVLGRRVRYPLDKLTKLSELPALTDSRQLYKALVSPWRNPEELVVGGHEPATRLDTDELQGAIEEWMMRLDQLTYLPDDILVKVDRASMAVGLEARAPFLDPRVALVARRLPLSDKIRQGQTKWALRQLLYARLPRQIFERPKAGFALPLGSWLRGELKGWADGLLEEIPGQGLLRWQRIGERWQQHQAGQRDWSACLWAVLIFQDWLRRCRG